MTDLVEIAARALRDYEVAVYTEGDGNPDEICDIKLYEDEARVVLSALREAGAIREWRPIEEAPSKGKRVLICRPSRYNGKPVVETAWHIPQFFEEDSSDDQVFSEEDENGNSYLKAGWYHDFDGEHFEAIDTEPTHFQPLPQPPEER